MKPQTVLIGMISFFIGAIVMMMLYRPDQPGPNLEADKPLTVIEGPSVPGTMLTDNMWILISMDGYTRPERTLSPPPSLYLKTDGSTFNGFSGCNRMSGAYHLEGSALTFEDNIAMTRIACSDSAVETQFLGVLKTVTGWAMSGPNLVFVDKDNKTVAAFGKPVSAARPHGQP